MRYVTPGLFKSLFGFLLIVLLGCVVVVAADRMARQADTQPTPATSSSRP